MSHLLRYKFQPGDTLIYQQDVATVVEQGDDDEEPETELLVLERVLRVLEPRSEEFFSLEMSSRTPGSSQPAEAPSLIELNSLGGRIDDGELPSVRFLCFPEEPLEAGDSWTATEVDPLTGELLEVEYLVESFEPRPDDLIAHLVALATSEDEEEGSVTEVSIVTEFSVTRGHQVSSITVVETEWDEGPLSRSVFETKLRRRSSAD